MYMLLPAEPNIGFVTIAVVFVSATLLGFASHAPGGLGVFDAAMLVALVAIRQGRSAGRTAAVPAALLSRAVRARAGSFWARARYCSICTARAAKRELDAVTTVTAPIRSEIDLEKTDAG